MKVKVMERVIVVIQWRDLIETSKYGTQTHRQRYSMLAHLIQQSSYSCIWLLLHFFCPINVHFTPELPLLTDQLDHFTSALRPKCIKHISSGTAARSSSGETVWAPAGCRHRVQRLFHNHISVIRLQLIICTVNPWSQLHMKKVEWVEFTLGGDAEARTQGASWKFEEYSADTRHLMYTVRYII